MSKHSQPAKNAYIWSSANWSYTNFLNLPSETNIEQTNLETLAQIPFATFLQEILLQCHARMLAAILRTPQFPTPKQMLTAI